jgi:hypothetical protein
MKAYWRLIVSNAAASLLGADERDFYVSPKGDDTSPGTIEVPLKTIGRAVELSKPGKNIHPMSGIYEENVVIDKPVHIRPLRQNVAVLAGRITVQSSNVDINGMVFEGNERPLVIEGGMDELLIRQNRFVGCAGPAMHFVSAAGGGSFIIGNAISCDGRGPGMLFECGNGPQGTVIATNRFDHCETGIEVVACNPKCIPQLWDNSFSSCVRSAILLVNGTASSIEDLKAKSASRSVTVSETPATYVVAPNGDDTRTGSEGAPLATLGAAIQKARAGDTVLLRGGDYVESGSFEASGTADQPLTIGSAPGEKATFHNSFWLFRDSSHLVVRDICLLESRAESLRLEEGCNHSLFERLEIINGATEIHCFSLLIEGPGAHHNRFVNCRLVRTGEFAASKNGDAADISGGIGNYHNRFEHCWFEGYRTAFHLGHGAYSVAVPLYAVFAFNTFTNNSRDGIHVKTCDNLIYGNRFIKNRQGIGTRGAARNLIIGNCIEHSHDAGLRCHGESHVVWGNVFRNNCNGGIRLYHTDNAHYRPAVYFHIFNNTFIKNGPKDTPTIWMQDGTSARIIGNVFVGRGGPFIEQMPQAQMLTLNHNVYHNGLAPLVREFEGGKSDACLDPELGDGDGFQSRVMNSAARDVIRWPDGLPPIHPEIDDAGGEVVGRDWTPRYV